MVRLLPLDIPLLCVLSYLALAILRGEEASLVLQIPLARPARLSAGVYDKAGRLVRTLAYQQAGRPPALRVSWDGWSDFGTPCPPGAYRIRALIGTLSIHYQMTIGNGRAPSTPSDTGGVHAGQAVCLDNDGHIVLAGQVGGESPNNLQVWSTDGKLVRSMEPIFGGTAVAAGHNFFYVISYATIENKPLGFVYRFDKQSGRQADYQGKPGGVAAFEDPAASTRPGWAGTYGARWHRAHSIGYCDGRLIIAVPSRNAVLVMNANTGRVIDSIQLDDVVAATVDSEGRNIAIARDSLFYSTKGNKWKKITSGLVNPYTVSAGRNRDIYVIETGRPAPFHRWGDGYYSFPPSVTRISPNGKILHRIQRKGVPFYTPADGRVESRRLAFTTSVAADEQGFVYVTEPSLCRIQKLRPDGRAVWALHAVYAEEMCVDTSRPEEMYATHHGTQLRRYLLDYEKKQWRLDAVWNVKMAPGKFMTTGMRMARARGRRFLAVWDAGFFDVQDYTLKYLKRSSTPIIDETGCALVFQESRVYRLPCSCFDFWGCPLFLPEDKEFIMKPDASFNKKNRLRFGTSYHLMRAILNRVTN